MLLHIAALCNHFEAPSDVYYEGPLLFVYSEGECVVYDSRNRMNVRHLYVITPLQVHLQTCISNNPSDNT